MQEVELLVDYPSNIKSIIVNGISQGIVVFYNLVTHIDSKLLSDYYWVYIYRAYFIPFIIHLHGMHILLLNTRRIIWIQDSYSSTSSRVVYFDQLLGAVFLLKVVYPYQLLGAVQFTHDILLR